MKLYEISNAMQKVSSLIEDEKELTAYLDGLKMQVKEKAENIFYFMANKKANVEAIDNEIKRLQELKKKYTNTTKSLENYLSYNLQKNNIEKLETNVAVFSFRKSESVEIKNLDEIPAGYKKEKISISADKIAIKKAIKSGEEIKGVEILEHKNLQIK